MPPQNDETCPYVGRGGLKLAHALSTFDVSVQDLVCADFGCNVGGFTDCLLQAGTRLVYAVDTGYGALAWKLRKDPRVVAMERTNALHASPPEPVDLVVIDLAWTTQRHAIPAAVRWTGPAGRIISLIKPHYELGPEEKSLLHEGVLQESDARRIAERTATSLAGVRVIGLTQSPIRGGAGKGKSRGNAEWLVLLERSA